MRATYRFAGQKYWKIKGRRVVEINFEDPDKVMILFDRFSLLNHKIMGHSIRKATFDQAFKKALKIIKTQ
ncbi:MAG: hypothetical protein ACFB2Y_09720 [Fulvivirga sp.]